MDLSYTLALAALTQCLVATAGEREPENPLLTDENKWLATRHGLDAVFYDFTDGRKIEARTLANRLVEELRPVSQDLGCETELEGILEITNRGTGADLQRAIFEKRGSLEAVVGHLVKYTTS